LPLQPGCRQRVPATAVSRPPRRGNRTAHRRQSLPVRCGRRQRRQAGHGRLRWNPLLQAQVSGFKMP